MWVDVSVRAVLHKLEMVELGDQYFVGIEGIGKKQLGAGREDFENEGGRREDLMVKWSLLLSPMDRELDVTMLARKPTGHPSC